MSDQIILSIVYCSTGVASLLIVVGGCVAIRWAER
jgi:hypothetical protein